MWAIETFSTFVGWLKEPQEIDDREVQWIEMFVNFYVYLVEWVEYSMFSTEIRITIIPTVFNNVNLYELMWTNKGWSVWSERGAWSLDTWKMHNRFLSCFISQVMLANGLSL